MPNAKSAELSLSEWQSLLNSVDVNEEDLESIVLEYLQSLDLREVADTFANEASITASDRTCRFTDMREQLRRAISESQFLEAETLLNSLSMDVPGANVMHVGIRARALVRLRLLCALQQLADGAIPAEILPHIRSSIAPLLDGVSDVSDKSTLRDELERVMVVLLLDDPKGAAVGTISEIRDRLNSDVTAFLRTVFGEAEDPRLIFLLKNVVYSKSLVKKTKLPDVGASLRGRSSSSTSEILMGDPEQYML